MHDRRRSKIQEIDVEGNRRMRRRNYSQWSGDFTGFTPTSDSSNPNSPQNISKPSKSCNHRLLMELRINHLLTPQDKNDDDFMHLCLTAIGKASSIGMYGLLKFIINNVDTDLMEIYEIIEELKSNQHSYQPQKPCICSKPSISNKNAFNLLSTESISNIISFLDRDESINLKIVSFSIGIICLEPMWKYSFRNDVGCNK